MSNFDFRQFLVLVGAMIVDIFLVWFGFKLLFLDNDATKTQLFLLGCGSTIGGVFALSSKLKNSIKFGSILVFVGVYYFARSGEIIHGAWLARILGLASITAAIILGYIALPKDTK